MLPIERITVGEGPRRRERQAHLPAEATMDVETVQAVAPAKILYFRAARRLPTVNAVVSDGRAKIITFSAGGCDDGSTVYIADERALQAANAAGVNVFVSSGDHGAFNCLAFDPNDFRPTASTPSDDPLVISVGATFLERKPDGSYIDEAAWVEPLDNWGTGGALNPSTRRPSWQVGPGVDNTYSNGRRQEPDVSAPGDPESGGFIVVAGEESRAGGTSASSPFWAGVTSLFEQLAEPAGFLWNDASPSCAPLADNPPNTLFHDVVTISHPPLPAGTSPPGWLADRVQPDAIVATWRAACAFRSEGRAYFRFARHSQCSAPCSHVADRRSTIAVLEARDRQRRHSLLGDTRERAVGRTSARTIAAPAARSGVRSGVRLDAGDIRAATTTSGDHEVQHFEPCRYVALRRTAVPRADLGRLRYTARCSSGVHREGAASPPYPSPAYRAGTPTRHRGVEPLRKAFRRLLRLISGSNGAPGPYHHADRRLALALVPRRVEWVLRCRSRSSTMNATDKR